jgi:hypothetical protein
MKKIKDDAETRHDMRDRWKEKSASRMKKMSSGAQQISKLITSAHGDEWRRNDKVQRGHNGGKKK